MPPFLVPDREKVFWGEGKGGWRGFRDPLILKDGGHPVVQPCATVYVSESALECGEDVRPDSVLDLYGDVVTTDNPHGYLSHFRASPVIVQYRTAKNDKNC